MYWSFCNRQIDEVVIGSLKFLKLSKPILLSFSSLEIIIPFPVLVQHPNTLHRFLFFFPVPFLAGCSSFGSSLSSSSFGSSFASSSTTLDVSSRPSIADANPCTDFSYKTPSSLLLLNVSDTPIGPSALSTRPSSFTRASATRKHVPETGSYVLTQILALCVGCFATLPRRPSLWL